MYKLLLSHKAYDQVWNHLLCKVIAAVGMFCLGMSSLLFPPELRWKIIGVKQQA